MKRYVKRYYGLVAAAVALAILTQVLMPVSAVLEQRLIDYVIDGNLSGFFRAIWYVAAVVALYTAAYFLKAAATNRYKSGLTENMRNDLFDSIMGKRHAFFARRDTAEYISLISNDAETVAENYSSPIWSLIGAGFGAVVSLAVMVSYSALLAGVAVICSVLSFFVPIVITKHLKVKLVEKSNRALTEVFYKLAMLVSVLENSSVVMGKIVKFITYFIAGVLAIRGTISVGTVVLFVSLYGYFNSYIMMFAQVLPLLRSCKPVADGLFAVMDEKDETFKGSEVPSFDREIRVENLSFGYNEGSDVIKNLNLTIQKGEKLVIVGESGCGKSTLIKLLCGGFGGYRGRIYYDDKELMELDNGGMKDVVTVISQNVYTFNDTIRNNICLGEDFSQSRLESAVSRSGIDKFIDKIAGGLDGDCGEGGCMLSGGQRQRIAIARALIRGIDFLILDEGVFYIQNKDGVYMADEVSGTYGMVLKWSDMGTSGAGNLRCAEDGVFVCADVILDGNEGKVRLLRFEKSDAEYVGDRKQIVIGVSADADSYLEYMVKLFNSSQGLYEAVIKSYPYSSDRAQRLGTELLTGSGPDLIEANLFDINEYTAVGMVEDLREYLASSDMLDEDMLVESVLKVCSANGRLAVLPVAFGISALPGKASYIGKNQAWTFDELLESVEKNRGCAVGGIGTAYSTGEYLVMLAYMSDRESFVDWENFEAHFDSEKFVRLLSYASEYRVDDGYRAETFEKLAAAFADGENIIYDRVISCMAAYQTIGTILGDDAVFKGYPGEETEPVYKAQLYDSFAINSMSDNKEGAWKFMEFLLTEGYMSGSAYVGEPGSDTSFPIVKSKLQEVFDVAKEIKSVYDESGEPVLDAQGNPRQQKKGTMNGVEYYAATDEDVEAVSFMIEHIGSVYTSNQIIEDIIYEEISALFAGQSTPQATAELIQDRVQLYLDEKK